MANRTKLTIAKRKTFIAVLADTCNVTRAAREIGLSRVRMYAFKAVDEAFAAEWDNAIEEAADKLEGEAWRRAVEGVDKPVYFQGDKVDTVKEYSDSLTTLLLKAHRPEKFRERYEHDVKGGLDVNVSMRVIG